MKLFRIMMALMMVFALVMPVMAEDEPDVCEPCTAKCSPKDIGCASGDQFGSTCPFGDDYEITRLTGLGMPIVLTDCPVIVDICECDVISSGALNLVPGTDVSLAMTLLVDGQAGSNGAYFSEDWGGEVLFSNSRAWLCAPTTCDTVNLLTSTTLSVDGVTPITAYWCDADAGLDFDFFNEVNNTGEVMWRADSFNLVNIPAFVCPQAATNASGFFATNSIEIENVDFDASLSHMQVDVPQVSITPEIAECSTISIRIDLFIGTGVSICPTTDEQCSCVFDLYVACCDATANEMIFPYFTSLSAATFWNGIVITNIGTTAGTADLTAYEQDGSIATFSTPEIPGRGMYVNLLENIAWAGTGLGGSRCWIKVTTDFNVDGFGMLSNDTHDAMGYLPRLVTMGP